MILTKHRLVYLATPYSKYPQGIERAFQDASALAGRLLLAGVSVFSPIAHTHPIAIYSGIDPLDPNVWLPFDRAMINAADAMAIGMMPSWKTSFSINHEIGIFSSAGKPIYLLDPPSLEVAVYTVDSGQ